MNFPKIKFLIKCPDDDYYHKYWYKSLAGYKHLRVHSYSYEEIASLFLDPKYDYVIYLGADVIGIDLQKIFNWVNDQKFFISGIRDNGSLSGYSYNESFLNESLLIMNTTHLNGALIKSNWVSIYETWTKGYRDWSYMSNLSNPAPDYFFHYPIMYGFCCFSVGYMSHTMDSGLVVVADGLASIKPRSGVSVKSIH